MTLLQTLGSGQGYLRGGFLGFAKSGKTHTATVLACGLKKYLNLDGPIVMFDTENGSEYVAPLVRELTGTKLVGLRSRAFSDLMAVTREVEAIKASVFFVDSITHPYREICDAYLKGVNEVLKAKGKTPRTRLEFQDWGPIKAKWAPWTEWYMNAPIHTIVCGRAGDTYEYQLDDETGRKELVKTGVKMKTETEFGFEPRLLVEMERVQTLGDKRSIVHRATVLGDCFRGLNAAQCDDPGFEFFLPHIKMLTPNANPTVDTEIKTDYEVGDDGNTAWTKERRDREILCEEIQGEIMRAWPGSTNGEKAAKLDAIEKVFFTRSWTKVEHTDADTLRAGLESMREIVAAAVAAKTPKEED